MNTEELKTFICLCKVKNFTLAAEQMYIAQSTVTNRIVELEKDVGKKLFNRASKKVILTEEGRIFLKYAERILELQDTSIAEMNAVSAYRQKIAVGSVNATYESFVKPVLDRCLHEADDVAVKVVIGHSMNLIQMLQDNVLDMAFSSIPLKRAGFECMEYDTDRLALVIGKGYNRYKGGVDEEGLKNMSYLMCDFLSEIGEFIRSLFPADHVFKLEVDNSSKLLPYLEEGLGYSFMPYKMVKEKIEEGVLEEVPLIGFKSLKVITYLIYRQNYDPMTFLKYAPKN
ncbi:MAG: LysR family transcriptional regulator [Lachnospiraceae bacterium]|jgi:transcriptional regulator, lysR family|nr:LysR family transcriptional regulator [Bacillota bacterium]